MGHSEKSGLGYNRVIRAPGRGYPPIAIYQTKIALARGWRFRECRPILGR